MASSSSPPPPEEEQEDGMQMDHQSHNSDHDDDEEEPPPLVLQLLRRGVHGAALLGAPGSGKTSLAFQAAYALAGRHPERQAVFLHCRPDGRAVATAVRPLVGGAGWKKRARQHEHEAEEGDESEEEGKGSWDYGALENVYLKRFTTAQHLLWYLGSLHNQQDHLLPGALVIDDLHRFPSSAGHDLATAASRVLSLLRDAADHIHARTGRPCWTLVTMETPGGGGGPAWEQPLGGGAGGFPPAPQQQQLDYAVQRLIPTFVRQLGAAFRVRRDRGYREPLPALSFTSPSSGLWQWGGGQQGQQGQQGGEVCVIEEEPAAAKLAKMAVVAVVADDEGDEDDDESFPPRPPGPCRFVLEGRVLRVVE